MVALANNNGSTAVRDGQDPFVGLFHGLAAELRATNPAWDALCSRATKLSSQLATTANGLGHFVEALQTVSDSANNVNGISRDIGAALTRFCIRQRAVEAGLRALGQTLQNQFATDLEKKCADWRQTISDAERRHQRTSKRLKNRQKEMAVESRNAFVELLHAQRNQFTGFIGSLLPVINAQLSLLDEGNHVREVRDTMELALNEGDAHSLVQAVLEDISCCPFRTKTTTSTKSNNRTAQEHQAWDQRVGLGLASSRAKSASQLRLCPPMANGLDLGGNQQQSESCYSQFYGQFEANRNSMPPPSTSASSVQICGQFWSPPTPSTSTQWPTTSNGTSTAGGSPSHSILGTSTERPRTISMANGNGNGQNPPSNSFLPRQRPPLPEAFINSTNCGTLATVKSAQNSPTKQKRLMETNHSTVQFRPAFASSAPQSTVTSMASSSTSCSVHTLDSSAGNEQFGLQKVPPPPPPPPQQLQMANNAQMQLQRPLSMGATIKSETTSTSSAALIAETLQQIDRLGLELENYCDGLDNNTQQQNHVRRASYQQQQPTIHNCGNQQQQMLGAPQMTPTMGRRTVVVGHGQTTSSSFHFENGATNGEPPVRLRPANLMNNQMVVQQQNPIRQPPPVPPPPPLPERRNSAISAATPTAPSIADIRSAGALAGSKLAKNRTNQPPTVPMPPQFITNNQRQMGGSVAFRHPPTPMDVPHHHQQQQFNENRNGK